MKKSILAAAIVCVAALAWAATTRNVVRERLREPSPAPVPAASIARPPTAAEAARWAQAGPEGPAPRAADFATAAEYQKAYDVWHQRHADRLRGEEIEREKAARPTGNVKAPPTVSAPATH